MKTLVKNNCTGCHTLSYVLQHRFDEDGWNKILELMKNVNVSGVYVAPRAQGERHPRQAPEGARRLSGARARPGRKLDEVQAAPAPVRRGGARRVHRIRRPDRGELRRAGGHCRTAATGRRARRRSSASCCMTPSPDLDGNIWFTVNTPEPPGHRRPRRHQDRPDQAVQGRRPARLRRQFPRHRARRQRHPVVQRQYRPRQPRPRRSQDREDRRLRAAAGHVADRRRRHHRRRHRRTRSGSPRPTARCTSIPRRRSSPSSNR